MEMRCWDQHVWHFDLLVWGICDKTNMVGRDTPLGSSCLACIVRFVENEHGSRMLCSSSGVCARGLVPKFHGMGNVGN